MIAEFVFFSSDCLILKTEQCPVDKLRKQRQKSFAKPDSKVQLLVAKTVKMDISKINLHSVQNGKIVSW